MHFLEGVSWTRAQRAYPAHIKIAVGKLGLQLSLAIAGTARPCHFAKRARLNQLHVGVVRDLERRSGSGTYEE